MDPAKRVQVAQRAARRTHALWALAVLVSVNAMSASARAEAGGFDDSSWETLRQSMTDPSLTASGSARRRQPAPRMDELEAARQAARLSEVVRSVGTPQAVAPCGWCATHEYASDGAAIATASGAASGPARRPEPESTVRLGLTLPRSAPPSAAIDVTPPSLGPGSDGGSRHLVAPPQSASSPADLATRVWNMGMSAPGLSPEALRRTVAFIQSNSLRIQNQRVVTIIDYTQPSSSPRMYVFDVQSGAVERHPVTHGSGSGDHRNATQFSNEPGSFQTPTGAFLTALSTDHSRRVGFRLVLSGAERANANAEARGIVMHGAWYARDSYLRQNGFLGRSQGCPALDPQRARELLPRLAGGSLVYHYGGV